MFEIIYSVFAIATAICTALFAYRFTMAYGMHALASIACAVCLGVVAGSLWLPVSLVAAIMFANEIKNAYHE